MSDKPESCLELILNFIMILCGIIVFSMILWSTINTHIKVNEIHQIIVQKQ